MLLAQNGLLHVSVWPVNIYLMFKAHYLVICLSSTGNIVFDLVKSSYTECKGNLLLYTLTLSNNKMKHVSDLLAHHKYNQLSLLLAQLARETPLNPIQMFFLLGKPSPRCFYPCT